MMPCPSGRKISVFLLLLVEHRILKRNIPVNFRVDSPVKNISPKMRVHDTVHQTPIFDPGVAAHARCEGFPPPSRAVLRICVAGEMQPRLINRYVLEHV